MKDKKILIVGLCSILLIAAACFGFYKMHNKNTDALKFKEEYESLNGTVRESDGAKYNEIEIPKNNPIKYVNAKEALDVMQNKKAIIYVGANWCPWCRNSVPVLLEVAKDRGINTIYYLNLDNEKSNYKVEDGKLVETNHGTDDYYKLLDFLKDELRDYVLTSDGKEYNTNEKRIYMPLVLTVNEGKVVAKQGNALTLDEDQNKYSTITKEQHDTIYEAYNKLISTIYDSSCNEDCN